MIFSKSKLSSELDYIKTTLLKNGYPEDIITTTMKNGYPEDIITTTIKNWYPEDMITTTIKNWYPEDIITTIMKNGYPEDIITTTMKNGYPEDIITTTIRYKCMQFSSKPKFGPERYPVYLKLPWIGNASMQLLKQIKRSVNNCFNLVKLHVVFKSKVLFPSNLKGNVSIFQNSFLIYKFLCKCDVCYIGRMMQKLEYTSISLLIFTPIPRPIP